MPIIVLLFNALISSLFLPTFIQRPPFLRAQQAQGFSHGHEHLLNWRRFIPQQNSYYIHHRLVCCRGWQHKSQVSIYSTVTCAQLSSLHHIVSCGATTFSTLASYASAHVYKYFGVLVGISFFGLFINMLP